MNFTLETQVAADAVRQASELCMAVRAEMVGAAYLEKGDKSPVTIADYGAQALVCRKLREAFADDAIVAEEDAAALRETANAARLEQVTEYVRRLHPTATAHDVNDWIDSGGKTLATRYWTLDPIDGTKGFLRNDQYAIALALVVDGVVQVAALACPALPLDAAAPNGITGVLFTAERGAGAWMTPLANKSLTGDAATRIHVANGTNSAGDADNVANRRFVESVEAAHGDPTLQEEIARAAGITRPALRMDSQAKYGAVARGDAVLYLRLPSPRTPDYREKIWDHAAGALLVEEAGGRVTDSRGRPLNFAGSYKMQDNEGVVASNGALHDAALRALRR